MMANIAVVDRDGMIIAINDGWERFARENGGDPASPKFGVGANYLEVCARSARDLGAEGQEILDGMKGVLAHSQAAFRHEYPCHSPTKQRWFTMLVSPLDRADGGAVIAQFDITERKRTEETLREKEEMLQNVLERFPGVVFWKDARSNYLGCNQSFATGAGLKNSADIIGKNDFDLPWAATEAENYRADDAAVMACGEARLNIVEQQHQAGGGVVWFDTSKVALRDATEQIIGVIGISIDITKHKRAEQSLEQTHLLLIQSLRFTETLLSAIPTPVFYKDKEGRYLGCNRAYTELMGVTSEALKGKTAMELWPGEMAGTYHANDLELMSHPVGQVYEYKVRDKDGVEHPVIFAKDVFRDEHDQVAGIVGAFLDITERKREEINNRRMATVLRDSNDAITIQDFEGRITAWNRGAELMYGFSEAEALLMNIELLTTPDKNAEQKDFIRRLIAGEAITSFETQRVSKDGRVLDVWMTVTKLMDDAGNPVGLASTERDITERKETDANLLVALDRAEAGNRAKSDFFTVMSHELRTPLNGVLGFAQLLSDTPLDDEQKDYVETIGKSGEHLLAIVTDILDFSSIEKGTLAIHVKPLAMADLVKTAADTIRKTAVEKGLELRCELAAGAPAQINGDKQRLDQILINLLGNAVKFTASGSVVLRVSRSGKGGSFLDFSVEDTGIGISPETLGRLFQPFVQADPSRTRSFGGTGLGLAISKRIAEAMGGSIAVASAPGKGSAFTFRLPLEKTPVRAGGMAAVPSQLFMGADGASPSSSGAEASMPLGSALVLVVDDDRISRMLAGKMLQNLGCQAEFAVDGEGAFKAFATGKYLAILMDMAMPVLGGLEATKKIREIESGSRVPIIALTANVMPGDRERCLAAGMDDFLSKPFKRAELAAILASVTPCSASVCEGVWELTG